MKRLSNVMLVIAILAIALGIAGIGDEMISGFALAIGAVMFILACVMWALRNAESIE